jgi:phosphate transport system substrate-binding protein
MKNLILLLYSLVTVLLVSCTGEPDLAQEDFTLENYPKVDGSTSTDPLNKLLACKLLGFNCEWRQALESNGLWYLWTDLPEDFSSERLPSSQTHGAFINLIDKKADLILSARKMSPDEKDYAAGAGVELIETPVALDALIFLTHLDNPVTNLTTRQIQDIYTGEITNWGQAGGDNSPVKPYVRNANSGSQELFESMIMPGLSIAGWPAGEEEQMIPSMLQVFSTLIRDANGFCYTVYYYKEQIVREEVVKHIAVDGVYPDSNTIKGKTYPYVAEVYAIIRADLNKTSAAYRLYELLQTQTGKNMISESGYIPY